MFRRRTRLPWVRRIRDLFWPRMGWRRSTIYVAHRIGRLPGSAYSIAAGFACGAAISFTPFMGFHFVLAALLALVVRGNVLASAIGTVVGNPWTFPAIWLVTYRAGRGVLGEDPYRGLPAGIGIGYIFDNPWQVFLPMAVGGVICGVVAWFAFFFPVRAVVAAYQTRRTRRRMARVAAPGRNVEQDLDRQQRGRRELQA